MIGRRESMLAKKRAWLGVVVLLLVGGCGGKGTGTVSGEVSVGNEKLAAGTVLFHAGNKVILAPINDGRYTAENVPVGEARVSVQLHANVPGMNPPADKTMMMDPKKMGNPNAELVGGMPPSIKLPPVPSRYLEPSTSGLTFNVQRGENAFNIPLN